ncbi:MAG: CHAT domain-containing protein [Ilumatobacter sp.]
MQSDEAVGDIRRLVVDADDDPRRVRDAARVLLEDAQDETLTDDQAIAAWALGLALRHLRELDEAVRWLRRAGEALPDGSDDHTSVLLTLAGTMAFTGELVAADELLAGVVASEALAGRVTFQRAAIAERLGEIDRASEGYQRALESFRTSGDRLGEAHALSGIGLIAIQQSNPADARRAYEAAHDAYDELGLELLSATATHNRGLAATRMGDLDLAAEILESAAAALSALGEPFVEVALDQVELLLLLGLPEQASDRAKEALAQLQRSGASTDRAELLVTLGVALHGVGHHEVGDRSLAVAERLMADQNRPGWQAVVQLRRLEVDPAPAREAVVETATELRRIGLTDLAADADVLALATSVAADADAANCVDRLQSLPPNDARRSFATALAAFRAGRFDEVGRVARHAISSTTRDVTQSTSIETRTARLMLRDRVSAVGVDAAVENDEPRLVVELLRAQQAATLGRSSSANAQPGPERCASVTVYDDGQRLVVVHSDGRNCSFGEPLDRAAFMDAMFRHAAVLDDALHHSLASEDAILRSAELVQQQAPWLRERAPLSLAVSGELSNAPWGSVANGPIRLVVDGSPGEVADPGTTLLIGPGLTTSDAEVAAIYAVLGEECSIADPADSIDAIERARGATLHISCHGRHDRVNPSLSSYDLTDGPLTGREIEARAIAPTLVVAAACRSGRMRARGSTAIGLPVTWVTAGASSVIASPFALPDDDRTVAAMASLHRHLLQGASPEEAVLAMRHEHSVVGRSLVTVGRLPHDASTSR